MRTKSCNKRTDNNCNLCRLTKHIKHYPLQRTTETEQRSLKCRIWKRRNPDLHVSSMQCRWKRSKSSVSRMQPTNSYASNNNSNNWSTRNWDNKCSAMEMRQYILLERAGPKRKVRDPVHKRSFSARHEEQAHSDKVAATRLVKEMYENTCQTTTQEWTTLTRKHYFTYRSGHKAQVSITRSTWTNTTDE